MNTTAKCNQYRIDIKYTVLMKILSHKLGVDLLSISYVGMKVLW